MKVRRDPGMPRVPLSGLILWVLATALASPVAAQEAATIVGTVVDATSLEPLPSARIEVPALGLVVAADADGRFRIERAGLGDVTLRVTHDGYGTVTESLTVTDGEIALFQFQLPRLAVVLDEILVIAGRADRARGGVEAGPDPDAGVSQTAADLLAQRVPGLVVDRTSGAVGGGARVQIRGIGSMTGSAVPHIYLDGIRIDDRASPLRGSREPQAFHVLEQIPASEVRRIRVLRGPSASVRYPGATGGVIVIETRQGDPPPGAND